MTHIEEEMADQEHNQQFFWLKRGVGSTSMTTTGGYENMSSLNNDDQIEEEDYDAEVSSLSSDEDENLRLENEKNET